MSKKKNVPDRDPFEVLGVKFDATDAEITKKYRKLALKLHPDKQAGLSETQLEKVAKDFHDLQQARAFLLDPEYAEARAKYKATAASQAARRQADRAREAAMSENRKRMREELKRQEEEAAGVSIEKKSRKCNRQQEAKVEELRRQGQQMRETHRDQKEREYLDKVRQQLKKQKGDKEERQVKLKWSRKRLRTSPSEDSLAKDMARFGVVETVEMFGSKGNMALITFQSEDSCRQCVDEYKDSDVMRASFVGKRKEREEETELAPPPAPATTSLRDTENIGDWKLRQAAEREKLLREMEAEEAGETSKSSPSKVPTKTEPFPRPFPTSEEFRGSLSPLQKLEKAETTLLKGVVTEEVIRRLKANTA